MSAIETTTDMSVFEGATRERWCHITTHPGGPTLCGFERADPGSDHLDDGDTYGEFCSGCGLRSCPDCQDLA